MYNRQKGINNMAKLLYQGHASLRFTTKEGKIIYVDPYAGDGYDKPADLVLITHEHYDHNQISLIPMTSRTITIRAENGYTNGAYQEFEYFGVKVRAVPAANKNHNVMECVGYLLMMDGLKIYVAGDTDYLPFMQTELMADIDYAFLPIDGIYNMGPEEATRVANIIRPKHLIPYHMHPGMLFDMQQDMKVSYENAMLVRPGIEIEL